ncbi:hypothetical protein cypCar_00048979, partial [Cyprinus carpio]
MANAHIHRGPTSPVVGPIELIPLKMPVRAHWITSSVDIFLLVHILLLVPPIPHRDLLRILQDLQVLN